VQKVAGEFLEVFDLADAIHLGNDPVEHALDFLVGSFGKERSLKFQASLMAEKLLTIELRNTLPFWIPLAREYSANGI
jgi:hypothetical protein